jgi:hypothetical protein
MGQGRALLKTAWVEPALVGPELSTARLKGQTMTDKLKTENL